jgi:hypothetical protein
MNFKKLNPMPLKEQFGKKARGVMYSLQIIYLKGFKKGLHTAILPTPRYCLCGELIFITNTSAARSLKKATGLTLGLVTFAKSIHPKNRKIGLTAMSLYLSKNQENSTHLDKEGIARRRT